MFRILFRDDTETALWMNVRCLPCGKDGIIQFRFELITVGIQNLKSSLCFNECNESGNNDVLERFCGCRFRRLAHRKLYGRWNNIGRHFSWKPNLGYLQFSSKEKDVCMNKWIQLTNFNKIVMKSTYILTYFKCYSFKKQL